MAPTIKFFRIMKEHGKEREKLKTVMVAENLHGVMVSTLLWKGRDLSFKSQSSKNFSLEILEVSALKYGIFFTAFS